MEEVVEVFTDAAVGAVDCCGVNAFVFVGEAGFVGCVRQFGMGFGFDAGLRFSVKIGSAHEGKCSAWKRAVVTVIGV